MIPASAPLHWSLIVSGRRYTGLMAASRAGPVRLPRFQRKDCSGCSEFGSCCSDMLFVGGRALAWSPELPVVQPIAGASSPSCRGTDGRVHLAAAIQLRASPASTSTTHTGTGRWAHWRTSPPEQQGTACPISVDRQPRPRVGIYARTLPPSTPYTVFYWRHAGALDGPEMLSSGEGDDGNLATSPRI